MVAGRNRECIVRLLQTRIRVNDLVVGTVSMWGVPGKTFDSSQCVLCQDATATGEKSFEQLLLDILAGGGRPARWSISVRCGC